MEYRWYKGRREHDNRVSIECDRGDSVVGVGKGLEPSIMAHLYEDVTMKPITLNINLKNIFKWKQT